MPRKFTQHGTPAALEGEFIDLWRRLDKLEQRVTNVTTIVETPGNGDDPAPPVAGTILHWAKKIDLNVNTGSGAPIIWDWHVATIGSRAYTHMQVGITVLNAGASHLMQFWLRGSSELYVPWEEGYPYHSWQVPRLLPASDTSLLRWGWMPRGTNFPAPQRQNEYDPSDPGKPHYDPLHPEYSDWLYWPIRLGPNWPYDILQLRLEVPGTNRMLCYQAWVWGLYVVHAPQEWGTGCPYA